MLAEVLGRSHRVESICVSSRVVRRPPSSGSSESPKSGRRAFDSRLTFVTAPSMCLLESPARRIFKGMAGQNNHFLITILVGLSAVEDNTATLHPEMRTSWAPHDRHRSAARSREFTIKAALAWLIDALDAYIRTLVRPPIVANTELLKGLVDVDVNDEGLGGRVRAVARVTHQAGSAEAALAEIAIVWRNHLVHQHATNKISKPLAKTALSHEMQFIESCRGLMIHELIDRVERRPPVAPTFKEVTAIVSSVHKLIERTDTYLLHELDLEPYARVVLKQYLIENQSAKPGSVGMRANKVWGKSSDRCRSAIRQILLNSGFTTYRDEAPNELTMPMIERLANLSPAEAIAELV
jgi:hypothetical protein